ncbi:MAG: BTAD domain-containing putative transcriptional regulator [Caldilineaceae bacterium]
MAEVTPAKLEIALFGGLRVLVNDELITTFMSAKAPALLAYLASAGRVQRRDDLAALLWGELPEADAKNNLRQVLTNLRRFVEPFLIITRETVAMNAASTYRLDVADFDQRLAAASTLPPPARAAQWQAAGALYTGDFLSGFFVREAPEFEEWMLAQRAHYRQRALYVLHTLTQYWLNQAEYEAAIHSATRLLALDEWREEAHCQLMLALARSGQRSAALAQYKRCRQILQAELGVGPAVETVALGERIRAALTAPRHNLPAALTGFVGRAEEMAALRHLLADPDTRLLTIVGVGGVGKTRLALEAAAACEPTFLNGAWFTSLAGSHSRDIQGLVLALADIIGCPLNGPDQPQTQLLAFLQQREVLLILDNLETLIDGVAWLSELLAKAPGVTILATARERLNLQAEQIYGLEGFALPPQSAANSSTLDAVQLFIQAARRVQPAFALTPNDEAVVMQICRAVHGLPLGIELAAAWTRHLSCREIAAEIAHSLDFLATDQRDVPERQRTLRVVFEWSWQRLRRDEQIVFQRLALFYGPFTRAAAAQVAGAALPILATLVDKSLLRHAGTVYQLHEVARHFAAEKLGQSGEADAVQARHAAYYAAFLAARAERIKSGEQKSVLAEIECEVENVRAAWRWLSDQRDIGQIEAAIGAFYHFHLLKSRFREGLASFEQTHRALEAGNLTEGPARLVYTRLLARAARFHSSLAQYAPAQRLLTESLARLHSLDAPDEEAFVLGHMGGTARMQGDLALAERHLLASLTLRRQLDDRWGQAITLLDLAGVAFMREEYTVARQRCEEGLAACASTGDLQTTAHLMTGLSLSYRELKDYPRAAEFGQRSLRIYDELADKYGAMQAALTLGELNRQLGYYDIAQQFCTRALLLSQEIGDRSGEADGHYRLGQIAADMGERGAALDELRLALQQAAEIQETLLLFDILLEIASLLVDAEADRAAQILTFLWSHPQLSDQRRARVEALQTSLTASRPSPLPPETTLEAIVMLASSFEEFSPPLLK